MSDWDQRMRSGRRPGRGHGKACASQVVNPQQRCRSLVRSCATGSSIVLRCCASILSAVLRMMGARCTPQHTLACGPMTCCILRCMCAMLDTRWCYNTACCSLW